MDDDYAGVMASFMNVKTYDIKSAYTKEFLDNSIKMVFLYSEPAQYSDRIWCQLDRRADAGISRRLFVDYRIHAEFAQCHR